MENRYGYACFPFSGQKTTENENEGQREEKLEGLAYKYYQDTSLWWIIAGANNIRNGSFALDPSEKIRIPRNIQPILEEFRRINEEFQNR